MPVASAPNRSAQMTVTASLGFSCAAHAPCVKDDVICVAGFTPGYARAALFKKKKGVQARSHGVGYYGFSQDETVRRSQQDSLQKLRLETKREQEATKDVKERQAEVIEEPEQEESKAPEEPKPTRKSAPVRPWDIGKEGVKEVMSQEEWVKKKRTDRPQEFAPPSTYQPDFIPTLEQEETRPKPTLFFSSKKPASSTFQPTPIEDEIGPPLSYSTKHSKIPLHKLEQDSPSCSTSRGQGAEVPPPPTFDYYGPSSTAPKRKATAGSDLESSISAGLKFLRQQAEDRERKKNKGLLDIV
ncbi:hypothetical protein C0J52_01565 [Blattella germanica]|nr:hypothetical protein C0J52_01565 [Blattella germanica]